MKTLRHFRSWRIIRGESRESRAHFEGPRAPLFRGEELEPYPSRSLDNLLDLLRRLILVRYFFYGRFNCKGISFYLDFFNLGEGGTDLLVENIA